MSTLAKQEASGNLTAVIGVRLKVFGYTLLGIGETVAFALSGLAACASRFLRRADGRVGFGPEPLINHVFHQRALEGARYDAETFSLRPYYISRDFNFIVDWPRPWGYLARWFLLWRALFRFDALFVSFAGGCLGGSRFAWRYEPWLYRLAAIHTVVLPYGSDAQEMSRCPNLLFKDAISRDYPDHRLRQRRIEKSLELWTQHGDHVIGGCDWVDYLPHWDSLTLGHFSIDTAAVRPQGGSHPDRPLRIVHAPNHRSIKGTEFLVKAVEELKAEGVAVELTLIEQQPNTTVLQAIEEADVVADQFVIGWYAMFALEGMAMAKPVLCYIRPDLERFYIRAGLLEEGELPIVRTSPETIADELRRLAGNRALREELSQKSRAYVCRHHSLEAVGGHFGRVLRDLGVPPRARG